MVTAISFRVLGPLEVEVAGRSLPLGGPKPRVLLAALLLQAGVTVSTDQLVDVLWPTTAPRSAAANIRTYVHSLRRRLAEVDEELTDRIQSRSSGYILTAAPDELDMTAFTELAARAQRALAAGEPKCALELLDRAEALWRGEILEDLPHSYSWTSTCARLSELRLSVRELRLRVRIELGEYHDAIVELRGLLADHPLREELWSQLIVALDASGRKAEALQAYAQVERILRDELNAQPGAQLRKLRAQLGGPGKPAAQPAAPFPVCQLPLDLPDFTGRDDLVDELVALLRARRERGVPAVTVLSGAPGVGKSTIAVRVAHAVRAEFPDGQLHLDLGGTSASPRTPMDVLPELLHALGVPDAAMPRTQAERSALLRSRLARRRLCVVLDDAANAAQVRPLLPGSGGCAVLVTSRARMPDLEGARPVDVDVLPEGEAERLLAGIVGPERMLAEPDSAAAILRSCGYLPLAIRVAGAKLSHRPAWTLRMLADRLRGEHRRLDELRVGDLAVRASVALSYDQLPDEAARAFRALGTLGPMQFPGWAVAALLDRTEADDVLDLLVDAHLVELVSSDATGQPRYRLHDLLRCFAAEQAERTPEGDRREAVRRLLEGYLSLATDAAERIPIHFFGQISVGPADGAWRPAGADGLLADPTAWFEAERRTAVAAIALAAQFRLDELAWRLAIACTPYFDLRGHHDDWQHTHAIALAAVRRTGELRGQAIVLRNLGQIHVYQDTYQEALAAFDESHRLFGQAGDQRGAAIALAGVSTALRFQGRFKRALDRCQAALELFRAAGDRHGEAVARIGVGAAWLGLGCYAAAGRWFSDAYELSAAIGDRHREAHALKRLAMLHQRKGNLGQAREHLDRAIAIFDELGDDHCVGYAHQSLGELCLCSGDLAHAQLLLVNSLRVHRRNGDRRSEAEVAELLGELHQILNQPERSRAYYERALMIWRELPAQPQESAVAARLRQLAPGAKPARPKRKRPHIATTA
ncbi:AfsR/SARP family transcriptional regulator [Amycolatopsis anabasis]|uniref:AfsR/SARP family transcriptional regulator n=1 Tax=Amycolatopsis anabasis TaxID=1840409 RepID=UPI00131D73BF|nr:BTAD domain-containing putative transcriptional regulator [Amycolatopsis anabasis]